MKTAAFTFPDRSPLLVAALVCALAAPSWAHAQSDEGTTNAGQAGGDLARQIIQRTQAPEWNPEGGRHEAGSFRIGDQEFEIAEMAPGATKSTMEQAKSRRVEDISQIENEGIAEYNRVVREEGATGDAFRTMYDVSVTATAGHPDVEWLIASGAFDNAVSQSFGDCKTTADISEGEPIESANYVGASCIQVPEDYRGAPSCSRHYEITIEKKEPEPGSDVPGDDETAGEESSGEDEVEEKEEAPACDTIEQQLDPTICPQYELKIEMVTFPKGCEVEAAASACEVEWQCTNPGPLEIDGTVIGGDLLDSLGIPPLFPGGPDMPRTCLAARASMDCPVCIDGQNGDQYECGIVDPEQREPPNCQGPNPQFNPTCAEQSKRCMLTDPITNQCALETVRYTCAEPNLVPTKNVAIGNSCDIAVQCVDGSCNSMANSDAEGMRMQEAMARIAITDTMVSDMSYDEAALAGANGGELTPEQQKAIDDIRMFQGEAYTCQKGYAGLVDCCGKTNMGAQKLYWSIYQRVSKDMQAARLEKQGGTSAYTDWRAGNNTMASLSNPFTSMRDNVIGGGSGRPTGVAMTVWQEFMARARDEIKPNLSPGWICKDNEFDLAIQREVDMCSYAGTYCSQRVLGACLKRRESYCCYQSPMSKALRASAEPGGVLNHGGASSPDCSGIRIEDLDKVKWESIDFTRLVGNMSEGDAFHKADDPNRAMSNYTGANQGGQMAQGRKTVDERSRERLESFDAGETHFGIAEDAQTRDYRVNVPADPGTARLSFRSSSWTGRAGGPVLIAVTRNGSAGGASATVTVVGGSPETVGFLTETIYWGAGDESTRYVRLEPPHGAMGEVMLELHANEGIVEGFDLIRVRIE